jgi:hypothetical protein
MKPFRQLNNISETKPPKEQKRIDEFHIQPLKDLVREKKSHFHNQRTKNISQTKPPENQKPYK